MTIITLPVAIFLGVTAILLLVAEEINRFIDDMNTMNSREEDEEE